MARLTLPSGSRMRRSDEIRRVFDARCSSASGPVVVYAAGDAGEAPARYALVVGKKWGGAVVRNRIRRLLREAFRHTRPELPRGFDFVLLPRAPFDGVKAPEVRRHLERAARRATARWTRKRAETP